jgi:hypothetical protein
VGAKLCSCLCRWIFHFVIAASFSSSFNVVSSKVSVGTSGISSSSLSSIGALGSTTILSSSSSVVVEAVEEVGVEAKEAMELVPDSNNTIYAHLGSIIREIRPKAWQTVLDHYDKPSSQNPAAYKAQFPWKLGSKIPLPPGTKRRLASTFYQLKLGHGYLKSYLHRLGHWNVGGGKQLSTCYLVAKLWQQLGEGSRRRTARNQTQSQDLDTHKNRHR